jgi:hypothetical protein
VREFVKPHKDTVLALDFSVDGRWLASGSSDRAVRVWDAHTGKLHRNLEAHSSQVLAVSLRGDGRRVASGSADNSVKTWDIQRSDVVATFATFTKEVGFLRYLGRGDELVAASGTPAVKILKDAGGETRAKTEGFKRFITAGAASKDGASQLVGDAVTILGRVQGTVRSAGVLQLGADAQVEADLGYGDLYIQPGAVVIGALSPSAAQTVSSVPQWAKA